MLDDAAYVLVVGIVRVDEGRLLRGVVVVLVLVFLGLSDLKYFSVTEKYFNVLRAASLTSLASWAWAEVWPPLGMCAPSRILKIFLLVSTKNI